MVFDDRKRHQTETVLEFGFLEYFVEDGGHLLGGIMKGPAAEGAEHQGIVSVQQADAQDGPYLVARDGQSWNRSKSISQSISGSS